MAYYIDGIMMAEDYADLNEVLDDLREDGYRLDEYRSLGSLPDDKEYLGQLLLMSDALKLIQGISDRGYAINHECEDFLYVYGMAQAIRYGIPYVDIIIYLGGGRVDSDMEEVFHTLANIEGGRDTLYYHILRPILRGHVDILLPKADDVIDELKALLRIHSQFTVLDTHN